MFFIQRSRHSSMSSLLRFVRTFAQEMTVTVSVHDIAIGQCKSINPLQTPVKNRFRSSQITSPHHARKYFETIRNCNGLGLSTNIASTLVLIMAKHQKMAECMEMVRYCEKQDVGLKPVALLTAFSASCETKHFDDALRMFETLCRSKVVLEPWVFGCAMNAASTLNRHKLVACIFQRLVQVGREGQEEYDVDGNTKLKAKNYDVFAMMRDAHKCGIPLSEFALRALVSFADKSYNSNLAIEAISMMQEERMTLSSNLYNNVLKACGKNERWSDVLDVFEIVPEDMYVSLSGSALGSVVMAITKSGDEELIEIGLDLFNDHPSKWFGYACNAAMMALLQTNQYDQLLALANEMKSHRLKWSPFTYKMVVTALIRNGSIGKAREVLQANAKRMRNNSATCYGELVDHYAQIRGDTIEALHLCEEMLQNNWHIEFSDWCTALNLTHELCQQSASWRVRKQLWLRAESFKQKVPYDLLVLQQSSTRNKINDLVTQTTPDTYPVSVNVLFGLEVFYDFQSVNGSGLTSIIATKLLETMAKHRRIDECLEMLDYFKEQKVDLKPTARMAAFRMFCHFKEDGQALKMFESMLSDDLAFKKQNISTTLIAAMEYERHEVIVTILDYIRKHGKEISNKDSDKIKACLNTMKNSD